MKTVHNTKAHWEDVFETKETSKVSWFQNCPSNDVSLIKKYLPNKDKSIIDIGGGDSSLPDLLIANGYTDITLLDISKTAIENNQARMGKSANCIHWKNEDVTKWKNERKYNLWFDRAAFHFLSNKEDQEKYSNRVQESLVQGGIFILGTFSKNEGPTMCSNLEIQQYDKESVVNTFGDHFILLDYFEKKHITPSGSEQNFSWSILKRK